jgi:hypothetical protein
MVHLNSKGCFAALDDGNHEAANAIAMEVPATSKKSVAINFTGK